jgi:subtilase family serine protease
VSAAVPAASAAHTVSAHPVPAIGNPILSKALTSPLSTTQCQALLKIACYGDDGATNFESDASTLYPFRMNSWPSSDPLVTSLGGTMLNLDNNGNKLSPDVVWNDGFGAGGGGVSPIFSGIVALADQVAGHRLGLINPGLYLLGALGHFGDRQTGLVDVTSGNNSFGVVTGFTASPGYDLASGWGTIDAAKLVPALAKIG